MAPGYQHHRANVLRHVTFVEPETAFALIVHWRRGTSFEPYKVGLLRTTDNGIHWRHVHVFEGPYTGDVNERHMLTLQVQ